MDTRWQLVAYVLVSIILRMVAAQLSRRRTDIAWVRFLSEGWAASVLRFGYYIGLPYIALILGVVPGRYMGLVGLGQPQDSLSGSESGLLAQIRDYLSLVMLNWLPDVGTVVALGTVTLLFLSVTWLGYAYFRGNVVSSGSGRRSGRRSGASSHRGGYRLGVLHQVVYQAVHWSFYRSAVWLLSGDLYLGAIGGIILVGGEWVLDAEWVHKARHARAGEVLLTDASVLVSTSLIFFFVPNLWLLIPVHWLLVLASRRVVVLGYERAGDNRSGDIVYQIRQRAS
jgi:hypothetical protein